MDPEPVKYLEIETDEITLPRRHMALRIRRRHHHTPRAKMAQRLHGGADARRCAHAGRLLDVVDDDFLKSLAARHDQRAAAVNDEIDRARAEMHEMPVRRETVLRRVLAHGRYADAIGKDDRTKLKGRKKRMAHCPLDDQMRLGMLSCQKRGQRLLRFTPMWQSARHAWATG